MSLTPKDWSRFQHYKDRSPPWIKLHRTLLDNPDFHCMPVDSRALAPLLWLYAAEFDDGQITATYSKIAWRLRMSLDAFMKALKPLIDADFFVESGVLAECKRDAMPEREKEAELEKEAEADIRSQTRPARAPSRFDEFWKSYPRREGPNPRAPAEKRFDTLVKTGLDPQMLVDEVRKFAALEDTRKNLGSRFIPQAVTWLNQQRWSDHAAIAFLADEPLHREMAIEQALAMWVKVGRWSLHAPGAPPGEPGCIATVEQLAAAGLDPHGRKLPPEAA